MTGWSLGRCPLVGWCFVVPGMVRRGQRKLGRIARAKGDWLGSGRDMPDFKVAFRLSSGALRHPLQNYPWGRRWETWWTGEWYGDSLGPTDTHREQWNNSGRITSFKGDTPSPLRNDAWGGRKRHSGQESGIETHWAPLRHTGNAGRIRAALRLLRGALRRPSRMIRQGGQGDAVDGR